MAVQKQSQPLSATRLTYSSGVSFHVAESRLRASIQKGDSKAPFSATVKESFTSSNPRESFVSLVNQTVGEHGFMWFYEVDHGAWLPLFSPPTAISQTSGKPLKAKRFILGNPLIAITMIKHDLDAGAFAPVEMYLVEEDKGCKILWYKPSGLIAGHEGASTELRNAAERLDEKLEALVMHVLDEADPADERASL